MKSAYFFINGKLKEFDAKVNDPYIINFDEEYNYEIYNFGVSKYFDECKKFGLLDLITDTNKNKIIFNNTYIVILKIQLTDTEFNSIDDYSLLADFDILEKIKNSDSELIYSAKFDNENFIEDFI